MGIRDTKGFVLFGTLLTRTGFILYGGVVLLMFYQGEHITSRWWSLCLFPLPGSIFELLVVIFALHGREWKSWFYPSFFLFLLCTLPAIWLVELHKIENHVLITEDFELMSSHKVHIFGANATVTLTLRMWAIILETTTLLLLVFARWIQPTRHLSDRQIANLWLLQAFMAADMLELLDLLQYKRVVADTGFVYATLSMFSLSCLQFTFMIGTDKSEQKEEDVTQFRPQGQVSTMLFGTPYSQQTPTMPPENRKSEILLVLSSVFLMNLPFAVLRMSAIVFFDVAPFLGLFFLVKNLTAIMFALFRVLRLTVLRNAITINVVPPPK